MKRCSRCKQTKPLDDFGPDPRASTGRMSQCRECRNAAARARYLTQTDREHARIHAYYVAHRDQVLARGRANPAKNAAYRRAWRAANPVPLAAIRDRQRKREARHRELILEQLWEAQNGLCYLCEEPLPPIGNRSLHIDHDHRCCPAGRSCPNCRRGLAHRDCNYLIALAGEDPDKLRLIADNLEKAQKQLGLGRGGISMSGPFETSQQARDAAQLYPVQDNLREANFSMLMDSIIAAGVRLGAYDRRILGWLANYERETCAVIASLIARAAEPIVSTDPGSQSR